MRQLGLMRGRLLKADVPAGGGTNLAGVSRGSLTSVVVAAIGGLALWLAFPSWDAWPLAVVGPALLQLAVAGRTRRWGALLGGVFGAAFMLPLLHWSGIYVGAGPWVALAMAQAAFYAVLGAGVAAVSRLPAAGLWAALLWVAAEGARSRLPFGGLPWGRLGFSQADSPLAQLAALGGVPLVTFGVALTGCCLAGAVAAWRRTTAGSPWRRPLVALLVAALPWLLGASMASAGASDGQSSGGGGLRFRSRLCRAMCHARGSTSTLNGGLCWTTTSRPPSSWPAMWPPVGVLRRNWWSGRRTAQTSIR